MIDDAAIKLRYAALDPVLDEQTNMKVTPLLNVADKVLPPFEHLVERATGALYRHRRGVTVALVIGLIIYGSTFVF